jgi:membrane protease YdiL (CAAX protease family)
MFDLLNISTDQSSTFRTKLKLLFKLFFLLFFIKVVAIIINIILIRFGFEDLLKFQDSHMYTTDFHSLGMSLLLITLIYPTFEEVGFRGWFSRNRILTSLSLVVLILYVYHILIFRLLLPPKTVSIPNQLIIISPFLVIAYFFIKEHISKVQEFIAQNYSLSIVFSVISFASIHLLNYKVSEVSFSYILAIIIIMLPYFISGYLFAYIRIRSGIIWSIALHVTSNSLVLIQALNGHKI